MLWLLDELFEELLEALAGEFLFAVPGREDCCAFDAVEVLLGLRFSIRSASVIRPRMVDTSSTARASAVVSGDMEGGGEVAGGAALARGEWGGGAGATLSGRLRGADVV